MLPEKKLLSDLNSKKYYKEYALLYQPIRGFARDFICLKGQNFYALEKNAGKKSIKKKENSYRVWVSPFKYEASGSIQSSSTTSLKEEVFGSFERDFAHMLDKVLLYEKKYQEWGFKKLLQIVKKFDEDYNFPIYILVNSLTFSKLPEIKSVLAEKNIELKVGVNPFLKEDTFILFVEPALGVVHFDGRSEINNGENHVSFIMSPVITDSSLLRGFTVGGVNS